MRLKISLLLSLIFLILFSFKPENGISKSEMVGHYGLCGDDNTSDYCIDLQSNGEFTLVNYKNDSKNPVSGKWYVDGEKVMLTGYDENGKIPSTWRIEEEGKCIKARQQMQFIRLCSLEKCEQ